MPKRALDEARVTRDGVEGDWQTNRKYHGGCDRAICLYSVELYEWLRSEHGIDLQPGSVGENFTTLGLNLNLLQKGDRFKVGPVTLQLTKIRVPCRSLNQWDPRLLSVIEGRSGWMARVVEGGTVRPGDAIEALTTGDVAS